VRSITIARRSWPSGARQDHGIPRIVTSGETFRDAQS
jgi:hypothetical protein